MTNRTMPRRRGGIPYSLALLALVFACSMPSVEERTQERALGLLDASNATTASGARMALLSSEGMTPGAQCDAPTTTVTADSLVIVTRCAVAIPRDTLFVEKPDTTPPVEAGPTADITYACALRPNGRYRCAFDGGKSSAPTGIASYVWTTPGDVSQTGPTAVYGFDVGAHAVSLAVTDSAGATDAATVSVVVGDTLAPVPVDTAPPVVELPDSTVPPSVSVAALPRRFVTYPASLATAACTDTVTNDLQRALDNAKAGAVLCLSGEFRGTFTLGNRTDSGYVVVRSLRTAGTPGERMRPTIARTIGLARIVAPLAQSAIVTGSGAHGWYLRELEVTTDSTLSTLTYALVDVQTPKALATMAHDLVFDRLWVHGWAHRPLRRCIALNSGATAIVNSWVDECHEKGSDSQAIGAWSGSGPYLIENNYLAGAGENVLFGGADPAFPGVHPSDIVMRRNHIHTPLAWKGTWTKKNIVETKNVQRLLLAENVLDGSWADGQTGYALVIKSANQSGKEASRDNGSRDVTVSHNLIVNASAAFNLNGRGGDAGNIDSLTRRVAVIENYATDLGGAYGLDTRGVMLLTGAQHVRFARNTWLAPSGQVNTYTGGSVGNASTADDLTIDRDVLTRGKYGRIGCWTAQCAPGLVFDAAIVGTGGAVAPFATFPDIGAAHAAGYGVPRATIDALVKGVVVVP